MAKPIPKGGAGTNQHGIKGVSVQAQRDAEKAAAHAARAGRNAAAGLDSLSRPIDTEKVAARNAAFDTLESVLRGEDTRSEEEKYIAQVIESRLNVSPVAVDVNFDTFRREKHSLNEDGDVQGMALHSFVEAEVTLIKNGKTISHNITLGYIDNESVQRTAKKMSDYVFKRGSTLEGQTINEAVESQIFHSPSFRETGLAIRLGHHEQKELKEVFGLSNRS